MAKALKTVAVVVGAVALVASGIGAAAGAGLITLSAGAAATVATVASVVSVVAGVASIGATLLAKKPSVSVSGDATKFTANKDQGIPLAYGRTSVAGWIVHRQTFDANGSKNNAYQTLFATWGAGGPYQQLEAFQVDSVTVAFAVDPGVPTVPDEAVGTFHDYMYLRTQLGATPESAALTATGFHNYPTGWSASAKMSGHAGFAWTLRWDEQGKKYPSNVPQPSAILKARKAWDPRADSTYPGGSGSQRQNDPTTWAWTQNPFICALDFARGIWANGKRVMGIGFAIASIDVASAVHAANIADANGWTVGGAVYSTDGKWEVLKKLCAAGSGQPLKLGGILAFEVDAPRVSLATITDADIIGDASVVATPTISERINGVIPSCRLETQSWSIVPCALVQEADYVTVDGKTRTKAITWELVQNAAQVAQLAAYAITNAREFGPIVTPLKLRWVGYRPGDALTIDSPMLGMSNQPVVIQKRHLDPATAGVTLTMRSETPGKHAFALGQTASPPPTPSLQIVDRATLPVPGVDALAPPRGAYTLLSQSVAYPLSSDASSITIAAFDATLDDGSTASFPAGSITGLSADTVYEVFRDLGAASYFAAVEPALSAMASANNASFGRQATATTSGGYTPPATPPGGYRGRGPNYVEP